MIFSHLPHNLFPKLLLLCMYRYVCIFCSYSLAYCRLQSTDVNQKLCATNANAQRRDLNSQRRHPHRQHPYIFTYTHI